MSSTHSMSHTNVKHATPTLSCNKYKKQLQKIGELGRDGNAKKYSNKGGRDDNKYIQQASLHYTHKLT